MQMRFHQHANCHHTILLTWKSLFLPILRQCKHFVVWITLFSAEQTDRFVSFTASSVAGCSGPIVSIFGRDDWVLPAGEGFKLSCEFTCLRPKHVAQLWRDSRQEVGKVFQHFLPHELSSFICTLKLSVLLIMHQSLKCCIKCSCPLDKDGNDDFG